jgi:hypothetical protein
LFRRNYNRLLSFTDIPDKANSLPNNGADEPLILSTVADRRSNRIEAIAECRFRNNASIPDRRNEIVLADCALSVTKYSKRSKT